MREMKTDSHGPGTIRAGYGYHLDAAVGTLTHAVVAKTLAERLEGQPVDFPMVVLKHASELVDGYGKFGVHRSRILMKVASFSCAYFNRYLPGPAWTFLGAELRVDTGRVDLAWADASGRAFFDELKTTRHGKSISRADSEQLQGYVTSGSTLLGARFLGVRFIPLMFPASALLATPRVGATGFQSCLLSGSPLSFELARKAA